MVCRPAAYVIGYLEKKYTLKWHEDKLKWHDV